MKAPAFRAGFEDKAPHTAVMRDIPTYVVTHPQAALSGLADYARTPARFGLASDGRRWRERALSVFRELGAEREVAALEASE